MPGALASVTRVLADAGVAHALCGGIAIGAFDGVDIDADEIRAAVDARVGDLPDDAQALWGTLRA